MNGNFVHSLLLIDVLIRMKSIESDKQQLTQLYEKEYQTNNAELIFVREFEKDYQANKKKALRVQKNHCCFIFISINQAKMTSILS